MMFEDRSVLLAMRDGEGVIDWDSMTCCIIIEPLQFDSILLKGHQVFKRLSHSNYDTPLYFAVCKYTKLYKIIVVATNDHWSHISGQDFVS